MKRSKKKTDTEGEKQTVKPADKGDKLIQKETSEAGKVTLLICWREQCFIWLLLSFPFYLSWPLQLLTFPPLLTFFSNILTADWLKIFPWVRPCSLPSLPIFVYPWLLLRQKKEVAITWPEQEAVNHGKRFSQSAIRMFEPEDRKRRKCQ